MAGLRGTHKRPVKQPVLWIALCTLLSVMLLTELADLSKLPKSESRRANDAGQRAMVDPANGAVSLTNGKRATANFDVGSEEAAPPSAAASPTSGAPAAATTPNEVLPTGLPELRTAPNTTELPQIANSKDSLVDPRAPEVNETADSLILPKRGDKNITPAGIYARHFTRTPDQHLLSIVVLDTGLSAQSLPLLFTLPKNVTIAYSPYAPDAAAHIAELHKAGYETWGMLPAMSDRYPQDDPGPLGLVASLPKDEISRRLRSVMANTLGGVGLVLPPNEAIVTKPLTFVQTIAETDARGLLVLDGKPSKQAEAVDAKLEPIFRRADVVLDPAPDEAAITEALGTLKSQLKANGQLIVVTSSRPQTLQLLGRWLDAHPLDDTNILAPLSAQYKPKEAPVTEEEQKKLEDDAKAEKAKEKERKQQQKKPEKKKPEPKPEEKKDE